MSDQDLGKLKAAVVQQRKNAEFTKYRDELIRMAERRLARLGFPVSSAASFLVGAAFQAAITHQSEMQLADVIQTAWKDLAVLAQHRVEAAKATAAAMGAAPEATAIKLE